MLFARLLFGGTSAVRWRSKTPPMRIVLSPLAFAWLAASAFAQQRKDGPSSEKAQKSYQLALDDLHHKRLEHALDGFKDADKQDDGKCLACQKQMIKLGVMLGNWKAVELAAGEMIVEAQGDKETAKAHYRFAQLLMEHAWQKHKEDLFTRAHDETMKALASYASFTDAILLDGRILANLHQDAEA